jgi:hypothetical protein
MKAPDHNLTSPSYHLGAIVVISATLGMVVDEMILNPMGLRWSGKTGQELGEA